MDSGRLAPAIRSFKKSLKLGLQIAPEGDLVCEAYRRLAEAHLSAGDLKKAQAAIDAGYPLCEKTHDDRERAAYLRVMGDLALVNGETDESDKRYAQSLQISESRGFQLERAMTLETAGRAHVETGRPDTGVEFLKQAETLYEEMRIPRGVARLRRGETLFARPLPDPKRTRRTATRSVTDEEARYWERFGIYTRDPTLLRALDEVRDAAPSHLPILILGESGVGKELVAAATHALSGRGGSLIDINCPAIPETMLESELFGSERGAFTGAETRAGLVAEADRGSLFLDEIGDMPKPLQAKLLRFLETSTYRPVGGRKSRRVDVRFISATNVDLGRRVDDGTFRSDLYHRIAGLVVEIPSLRRRPDDVELLARLFLARGLGEDATVAPTLDPAVVHRLREFPWRGNVRELKNTMDATAVRLRGRHRVSIDLLPAWLRRLDGSKTFRDMTIDEVLLEIERRDGNLLQTARDLGINRSSLYRRLERAGIDVARLRTH